MEKNCKIHGPYHTAKGNMGAKCPTCANPPEKKGAITGSSPFGALAFLPGIVKVAKEHGYALTVHGSLARDFDFVAVPWVQEAGPAEVLAEAIRAKCGGILDEAGGIFAWKPHGRLAYKFHLGGGPYVDLSIMPRIEIKPTK